MNPALYWLCTQAGYLNQIPRYGRTYLLKSRLVTEAEFSTQRGNLFGPPEWSWRKRGNWGFTVLKVLGVKDQYWNEYDRRHGLS
jgi:hypothetical protein